MNHRMEDNTVRFYVSFPVIIQVVMKNTGLYIVAGKPSMMRADIQTVPLSIIRNAFQVILQYGITVTCSEIFKGSCFTIHEVQSSPFSTNPDVSFFIFRQIPDKRIIQAFLPQRVIRIMSEYCYNVTETNSEELLVTSDKGVTFLNPFSGNTRFATLGANLPITSIADGCGILVCRNNELFVGGNDGLTSFYREDLDKMEKNYSLYFSELYIHNKRIYPGAVSGGILEEAFPFSKSIRLNYKQNNLIINFATTNYIDIQKNNEYQYRLVGFDDDWVSTSSSSIYYTNLDPGKKRSVRHSLQKRVHYSDTPECRSHPQWM